MNKKGKILIIDDNEDVLFALHLLLEPHVEKVRITTEPSRIDFFMRTFEPDVILLDMNFNRDAISGEEGFECLEQILSIDSEAVVIFMTAYADTEKAVRAIKAGATDFISKPWEKEKLLSTLFAALKLRESQQKVKLLKEQVVALSGQDEDKPEMIGESAVMKQVFNTIYKLSDTDANILILGENGTGKDLVARSIRFFSARKDRPFVSIDLGSIPETLFESELFGHEKGAFTDARTAKAGRIETAANGTLFLDEIGNLSPSMQSKLLTAIEKKEISRIGSTKTRPIDTRLICATNANIHQMVQDGTFRQDLLYRINTIEIHIPPLRERGEDIILLAEHFIERYAHKYKKDIKGITRDGKLKLKKYSWPGNVRELQHAIERAIILSDGGWLTPASFMLQPPAESKTGLEDILNLEKLKATAIEIAMKRAKGNVSQAAELLGITRYALYRYLEKTE
jgi:DNA-binding NtrC family response regulator